MVRDSLLLLAPSRSLATLRELSKRISSGWATFPVANVVARGESSGALSIRRECVYGRDIADAVTLLVYILPFD